MATLVAPEGAYAIRLTYQFGKRSLVFENVSGKPLSEPLALQEEGTGELQRIMSKFFKVPFEEVQQQHLIRTGKDALFLLHRKDEDAGVSSRLRQQASDK